jgi:4-amino-4-deoxy-L-arabinose transferase-like glycosyltransferase
VPFWGKPPLSFWAQALAMKLFGLSDFSVRLPAWLASSGIVALTARLGWQLGGPRLAVTSALVLASMALVWIAAGAVMTDTFLVFGTTLALVAFTLSATGTAAPVWQWMFFCGISIGLLAKGPLTLVLVGLPLLAWSGWNLHWRSWWAVLPWIRGSALTAALVLPWYVAAELKTPGFLDYFVMGEHFGRFVTPGWAGDLYGNAHDEPRGMIWVFLVWASFPWGLVGAALLLRAASRSGGRHDMRNWLERPEHGLVLAAALTTPLFFTMAGNILWTYLLPALPFLALLIAASLRTAPPAALLAGASLVPIMVTVLAVHLALTPAALKSEFALLNAFRSLRDDPATRLHYVGKLPHSARYYGRGDVVQIHMAELAERMAGAASGRIFLAVRNNDLEHLTPQLGDADELFRGRGYTLIRMQVPMDPHLDITPTRDGTECRNEY